MIPYEELAAALERWRIRNGLPGTPPLFADGPRLSTMAPAAVASYAPPAVTYAAPPVSSGPAAAAYAARPVPAMPPPPSAQTLDEDVDEFAEDDVLDEGHLDTEGPDFAMAFDDSAKAKARATATTSADDDRESTLMGGTDPGIVPPPAAWPEAHNVHINGGRQAATVVDDDDDGSTVVGGGKPPTR